MPSDREIETLGSGWSGPDPSLSLPDLPVQELGDLSMQEAVSWSTQRNPVIRAAYQNLVATQNSLGAAYGQWWPVISVSLTGGLYGQDSNFNGASFGGGGMGAGGAGLGTDSSGGGGSGGFGPNGGYFQSMAQVDATWNVLDPSRAPSIWKAKYQVRQAADNYVITYRDNRLQVESAFIALQAAVAQFQASKLIVDNDALLTRLTDAKVRLGVASRLDVAKQKTVLFSDLVDLEQAAQQIAVARAELAALLNVDSPGGITAAGSLRPLGIWPHTLEQTVAASLSYRKVIEQKLLDIKLNETDAEVALATYRPTLQLVNTLYWSRTDYWTESLGGYFFNPSTALTLTFTGFDGGQARMQAESARRRAAAAAQDVLATRSSVRQEAQSDFAKAEVGRRIVLASSAAVDQANKAIRLQTLRFNAGYGTITDVVQAQLSLAEAVLTYISSLKDYNLALISLGRNTGLNFTADVEFDREVGDPLARLNSLESMLASPTSDSKPQASP
jgi:outer membrane protein TolC